MLTAHVVAGVALVTLNVLVLVWGLWAARRSATRPPGSVFSQALALSQTMVLATGLFGLFVLGAGERPEDPLHARVYGPFMLVVIIGAYGFRRPDDGRWNVRVYAVAALFVALLGVRALQTG